MAHERRQIEAHHGLGILRSFFDSKVVLLSLNYIGIVTASLGMLLFLPQIIKELGVTNVQVGWLTMIPYICGAISMVFCGWLSDRIGDRRWSLFTTCVISTVGLVIAGLTIGSWWSLAGITIAAIGFYGTKGPFWSIPTMFLTGAAAATGIALDQFPRQPRRVLWAVPRRMGQEPDRQLCRRALRPRSLRAGFRRDFALLATHPAPCRRSGSHGHCRIVRITSPLAATGPVRRRSGR
jgi:hypothetical protein